MRFAVLLVLLALAAAQYLPDVERWGYEDARLEPHGTMTPEQVEEWTDGVITGR